MPFKSEKQRRYLWANEPEIARDWTDTYGSKIKKADGGITRIPFQGGGKDAGTRSFAESLGGQAYADKVGSEFGFSGGAGSGEGGHHTPKDVQKEVRERSKQDQVLRDIKDEKRKKSVSKQIGDKLYNLRYKIPVIGNWSRKQTIQSRLKHLFDEGYISSGDEDEGILWDLPEGYENLKDLDYLASGEGLRALRGLDYVPGVEQWGPEGDYTAQAAGRAGEGIGVPRNTGLTQGGGTLVTEVEDTPSAFQASLTGTADTPDYYVGSDPLASNIAWGKAYGVDPRTMGMTSFAAHGGRIPAAYGGIMDTTTGRRGYFLGSIGKIFGKVAKAAKKVFKSPLGKAALIGTGIFGAHKMGWLGQDKFLGKLFSGGKGALDSGWNPWKIGIAGLSTLPFFMGQPDEDDDEGIDYDLLKNQYAQELMRIKRGVSAGSLNPDQWSYLPSDYTYTGAEGGRAGLYAGGQSTPSDYTMEDALMTTTQDKLGGITDVMKQADLYRQGSVGQFYAAHGGSPNNDKLMARVKELQDEGLDFNSAMAQAMKELSSGKAQGGRIGYAHGSVGYPPITMGEVPQAPQMPPPVQTPQRPNPMPAPQPNLMAGMNPMMNPMGGRRMAQEGGLMDLGGMEKDYRNDGGFVPIGGEEKADDVPARLSKNEFVFTADAVRGAGDGDIDKGAEIMENIMKNLEEGGQISEETQGLTGAQEMFGVSERLSEVV